MVFVSEDTAEACRGEISKRLRLATEDRAGAHQQGIPSLPEVVVPVAIAKRATIQDPQTMTMSIHIMACSCRAE